VEMAKFSYIFVLIVALVYVADVRGSCDCEDVNPLYIDEVTHRNECTLQSRTTYINVVTQNYFKLRKEFSKSDDCKDDNLVGLIDLINEIEASAIGIVNTFFDSNECNPETVVVDAIKKDKLSRSKLTLYGRCAFSVLSPKCNEVVQTLRKLVYSPGNYLETSMRSCSILKSKNCKYVSKSFITPPTPDVLQCDCIKITYPPIPKDENVCFSNAYKEKLIQWFNKNMKPVEAAYKGDGGGSGCNYNTLSKLLGDTKASVVDLFSLLSPKSKFTDLNAKVDIYSDVNTTFWTAVREFIMTHKKKCYFKARQARQNIFRLADGVIGILTKCIGFVDNSPNNCTNVITKGRHNQ